MPLSTGQRLAWDGSPCVKPVNDYLEVSGTNRSSIGGEEAILAHRKIAANRLAIDCIYALSKEELSKVDKKLEGIVGDVTRQKKNLSW